MWARVFDGSGDFKIFLFYFDKVAMKEKEWKNYSLELF